MSNDQDKRPRTSREETTASILDAAETLFAERGFTAVTVRDIAAEAGVSHALVHRYLGSKEAVYRAMLRRHETSIRDAAPAEQDLLEASSLMLREAVLNQRTYVRLIAHSALHGLSYERTIGRFAATARLIELAEQAAADEGESRDPEAPDPRFVIASIVAMLIGWSAAREWVLRASDLDGMSDDDFVQAFERVVLDIERLYFPSLEDSPQA
jgi:AcrR family transcriptional regulator